MAESVCQPIEQWLHHDADVCGVAAKMQQPQQPITKHVIAALTVARLDKTRLEQSSDDSMGRSRRKPAPLSDLAQAQLFRRDRDRLQDADVPLKRRAAQHTVPDRSSAIGRHQRFRST
jgi:hypothetical protein